MQRDKQESGSILVIVVVGMTVFLGLLGLVVDVGNIYIQKARLVSAVDSVVLAGVQELPVLPNEAILKAYQYGTANHINTEQLLVWLSEANSRISAKADKCVELFFLRLFGFDKHTVSAEAEAQVGSVSSYKGVAPFGIVWDDFQFDQEYILKYSSSGGQHHGNFGALRLGGNGADNYRNNVKNGYHGILKIGDRVYTEPGNMSGPTYDGVKYRLNLAEWHAPDQWNYNNSRIVVVPVIDSLNVSGTDQVTIVGFAAFYLEGCEGKGNESIVRGRFIRHVVDGDIGYGDDYGLTAYRLIR